MTRRRSCGHSFKSVKCYEDIEEKICNKKCRKALACGHHCTKTCKEYCDPCMQMVRFLNKKLWLFLIRSLKVNKRRSCGHTTTVACDADPEREPCAEKCTNTLECSHDCVKLCFENCFPCERKVFKNLTHTVWLHIDYFLLKSWQREDVAATVLNRWCAMRMLKRLFAIMDVWSHLHVVTIAQSPAKRNATHVCIR